MTRRTTLTRTIMDMLTEQQRIERLAKYKAERDRGIMHTPEWESLMRSEQYWFNARPR